MHTRQQVLGVGRLASLHGADTGFHVVVGRWPVGLLVRRCGRVWPGRGVVRVSAGGR